MEADWPSGPYSCRQCLAPTWNEDDMCDACEAEYRRMAGLDDEPKPEGLTDV